MALKRKRSSLGTQVFVSHPSTPPTSSIYAALNHQPFHADEENEMPARKRRRMDSFEKALSLKVLKWSSSSGQEGQTTAAIRKRHAEDEFQLMSFLGGRKRKRNSHGSQVCDSHQSTPPTSSTNAGEENEMPARKRRRMDSFEKVLSLKVLKWSSSSGQEGQTTAAIRKRHAEDEFQQMSFLGGRKRKRSSHSSQMCDSHQSMPARKRRKTDHFEKLLSFKVLKWSSSSSQDDQMTSGIHKRIAEEDHSLQEPLSSDLDVLRPVDHVQSPPAPVYHSPVSPASAHNNDVDMTTEVDILSCYEIGRLLGKGAYGCVYEGKRLEDGLEVAVKIAGKPKNMKYIDIPGHPTPLPLEVGLLKLVNAEPKVPEIIQLLDWQDHRDHYIMVLERPSPCIDLFDFMVSQGGKVDEDTARFIMAQAAMAAHMCCCRGVFHRDVKLENLLINTQTLQVKLIDFGCGDLLQEAGYEIFCGTREYRPPEYCTERKYHGKPSTVWSLGILLFRLVCGCFPQFRDIEWIDDGIWFERDLSDECCSLIRALLHKSPSQRMDLREILLHEWFTVTE